MALEGARKFVRSQKVVDLMASRFDDMVVILKKLSVFITVKSYNLSTTCDKIEAFRGRVYYLQLSEVSQSLGVRLSDFPTWVGPRSIRSSN